MVVKNILFLTRNDCFQGTGTTEISLTENSGIFWKDTAYFPVLREGNMIEPQEELERLRGTERHFALQAPGPECLLPHVLSAANLLCFGKP